MSFQNKNKKEFENVYYKNKFNVYRIAMDYSVFWQSQRVSGRDIPGGFSKTIYTL